jgi:hypothetical protein
MKFFKLANHLHEVVFHHVHVMGRTNDVPSDFMISGLCVHPI